MNLKEWAGVQGIHPVTAYRWFRDGKLPVPARRVGGLILVDALGSAAAPGSVAVYARLSSADQRCDLDRQVARVTAWATGEGLSVGRVVTEVGSALNGKRRKFLALLRYDSVPSLQWRRSWSSTGIGLPAATRNTWRPRCPRKDAGCWWWTPPRSTTIWSGT